MVKQALAEVVRLGRAPTVAGAEIQDMFQTKSTANIMVRSALSSPDVIILTAEVVGKLIDRTFNEHHFLALHKASSITVRTELSIDCPTLRRTRPWKGRPTSCLEWIVSEPIFTIVLCPVAIVEINRVPKSWSDQIKSQNSPNTETTEMANRSIDITTDAALLQMRR